MPISNETSHDELISQLIAALHASRSLQMPVIEKLIRMTLIELGQSIARTQTQKPRKTKSPPRKKPAAVSRKLALVAESIGDMPDAETPRRNDLDRLLRQSRNPPIPRRRLPSRRTGSRG